MSPEEQLLRKIIREADYLTISTVSDPQEGRHPGFTLDTNVNVYHDRSFTEGDIALLVAIAQQEIPTFKPWND